MTLLLVVGFSAPPAGVRSGGVNLVHNHIKWEECQAYKTKTPELRDEMHMLQLIPRPLALPRDEVVHLSERTVTLLLHNPSLSLYVPIAHHLEEDEEEQQSVIIINATDAQNLSHPLLLRIRLWAQRLHVKWSENYRATKGIIIRVSYSLALHQLQLGEEERETPRQHFMSWLQAALGFAHPPLSVSLIRSFIH